MLRPYSQPWRREVGGITFVNTGSVGRPKDGDTRACYVLVEIGHNAASVEIIRVKYDVEAAVRGIEANGLPSEFAFVLRNGADPQIADNPNRLEDSASCGP